MSAGPVSRSWRRYSRFSVRGLIVLVLVIGAGLGWLVRSARIQREAVAAIWNAGGVVYYDWQWDEMYIPKGNPRTPRWLADLIGFDYFDHAAAVVSCQNPLSPPKPAIDAVIVQVGSLTRLQRLNLGYSSFSEAGLVHLKGLTNLSDLGLACTQVTDVGLANLKGMTKLSELSLFRTQVTDAGLVHLKGMTNLNYLVLGSTLVTDAGLVHLKGLTKLTYLDLDCTQVTDAGLVHLKGLTKLNRLDLDGTQVTVAGMNELKQALPKLTINR